MLGPAELRLTPRSRISILLPRLPLYTLAVAYVEMDPALILKAIEGYQNELEPKKQGLDAFYRQFRCKRCSGPTHQETHLGHCFSDPDSVVPRSLLRCEHCACLFDPHSSIILELGDPDKVLNVPLIEK